jgi:hypothetical protein
MWRRSVVLFLLFALSSTLGTSALLAEESRQPTTAELQQAIYDVLVAIEKARGGDSIASDAFYWADLDIQKALEAIPDKAGFLEALTAIKHRSMAARLGGKSATISAPPEGAEPSLNGTAPFSPAYPDPYLDTNYQMLLLLGLAPNLYQRCDGEAFAYYQAALYGASITMRAAQMACSVAGCDPTGVVCAAVCGATQATNLLYTALLEPVEYCKGWASSLDAAENQAAYMNSASILRDLDAHDDRILSALASQAGAADDLSAALAAHDILVNATLDTIKGNLATHDTRLGRHDADIKALLEQMLSAVVANQTEIIKLLKTPEGRRPGWGKEGY